MTDWAAPGFVDPPDDVDVEPSDGQTDRDAVLHSRRVQYETAGMDVDDVDKDPVVQWDRWFQEAYAAGVAEPNAISLATVGLDGAPDSRIVLIREAGRGGLVFYTNYDSAKSRQFEAHPHAAAVFSWLELHRQVRIRGRVEPVSDEASDLYFASRPRASQLGAWASPQSKVVADRAEIEALVAARTLEFADEPVPRPPNWGGWRLVPTEWEFWQGRSDRLHDRLRYRLSSTGRGADWDIERLAP